MHRPRKIRSRFFTARILSALMLPVLSAVFATAQQGPYPQGYFRNPLNVPMLLAGNFGECRPGHFHSGLDIKTGGKENLPVFAAAEGYISRIKMEPGGFGHGIYITHPNGYTTLYAHLNDFVPPLQQYVRQQQYAKESWTVDLSFRPDQFPVMSGAQIAWSGNTGGSTAPHLHFEIRDTKTEHPLNPQLFGFEVEDDRAPVLRQISVYDMEQGLYNSKPVTVPVRKGGEGYSADTVTISTVLAGIGIVAEDYMNGSDNTLAFYTAEWYGDDVLQGRIRLDDIGYEETRYLHAYADYRTKHTGGPWIQCLFRISGNRLGRIYESLNQTAGAIAFTDGQPHRIRIVLTDVSGNKTEASFLLRISPSYMSPPCKERTFYVGKPNAVEQPGISFVLDEHALYETVCMPVTSKPDRISYSARYNVGRAEVPVHQYFDLQLKPSRLIPFALRGKIAMIYSDGRTESGRAAAPAQQGWYKASVRAFGEYRLSLDTIPPLVKPATALKGNLGSLKSISFRASDNMTSVRTFRAELDGRWILFEQHGSNWTHVFDGRVTRGPHRLLIAATDENGNESRQAYSFTR